MDKKVSAKSTSTEASVKGTITSADEMPIKKISIETNEQASVPIQRKRGKRILLTLLGVFVVFLLIIGGTLGVVAMRVYPVVTSMQSKGTELQANAQVLMGAIKNQNIDETKQYLGVVRGNITSLQADYEKVQWLKNFPYVSDYIEDGNRGFRAALAGLTAGDRAIEALEPNADLLGLKGNSNFVAGSADERVQTAVKTMTALIPKINEIAVQLDIVRSELEGIDPNRYPEQFQGKEIRSQLVGAKATIENAANLFVNAQPLLTKLPSILGEPESRRYLVLFQNDKELRPTGGFLTAFAQFRFERGKAILERSDDIYRLDEALTKRFPLPDAIATYHKNVSTFNIRDSNLSPDFKLSMDQFTEMYDAVSGTEEFDGIIAMDTNAVVEALRILGPITVSGRTFSAENDPRCDCPKAVYELEDYSTRPVNYVRTDRKDIIGDLMQLMLRMALGTSPSQYWGQLFQMGLNQVNEKHVLAYFKDPETQKAVEAFNMAGRIVTKDETPAIVNYKEGEGWDYLHINHANMAGQKANLFVTEEFAKEVTVNSDGTITTKLTVDYSNPFEGSDCNLERGGLCLNAPLRNWVRVYVPQGSTLKDSKGTQSPRTGDPEQMKTYDELGKTVFEGFLIVNPKGIAKLELTYTSPVKVDGQYKLFFQKQAGVGPREFQLTVDGKKRKPQTVLTDTEFVL